MKTISTLTLLLTLLAVGAPALAGEAGMKAEKMNGLDHVGVVNHYVRMGSVLADDSVDGVHDLALLLTASLTPGGKEAPVLGEKSLAVLRGEDLDLETARQAYRDLSRELIPLLQSHFPTPAQENDWAIYRCVKTDGEWIQAEGEVRNPYAGKAMLHCGRKVGEIGPGAAPLKAGPENS